MPTRSPANERDFEKVWVTTKLSYLSIKLTAEALGVLLKDRDLPLPSSFMTLVRGLGEQYQLVVAPVEISPEEDQSLLH